MIYTVSSRDISDPIAIVPAELAPYISERDWVFICDRFRGIEGEACCFGLLIAFLLCICITPIAFLLCPCFVQCRLTSEKDRICREINYALYQGHPVLSHGLNSIMINTDHIPGVIPTAQYRIETVTVTTQQPTPPVIPMEYVKIEGNNQPQMASAAYGTVASPPPPQPATSPYYSPTTAYAATATTAATAAPAITTVTTSPPRMMAFTVPPNATAGGMVRVMSPVGTAIDVRIPAGVKAGEEIMVPY